MENRTMVEIKNLKKTFPGWDHPVLNGVDITVKKGDVVVILGPSGSGKTTLLRCINFLGKADEGQMTIGDMSIDFKTAKKRILPPSVPRAALCSRITACSTTKPRWKT